MLFFDLDGTLWDSVDAICISWNRALERLAPEYAGTVTRARLLPCMGMLLPDILHRLVPELDQERMKPILEEVLVEEEGGRFGYCYENGRLEEVISRINRLPNVKVAGLHLHSSTQSLSLIHI